MRPRSATPTSATLAGLGWGTTIRTGAPSPSCQSAPKLRSYPIPAGSAYPSGHPQVLSSGLNRDPSCQDCQPTLYRPLGSTQAPEGNACYQAWRPGPAPVAWARPRHHLPRESASFLPFTFCSTLKVFIGGEDSQPPLPPGSLFLKQEPHRSLSSSGQSNQYRWRMQPILLEGGRVEEPRLGMHERSC